jgi:periplasmic divalent cation tolerance protein
MNEHIVTLCTVPDQATARQIAGDLLTRRLAACVNVSGAVESHYWWEGKIQRDEEFVLIIKTRKNLFSTLAEAVRRMHPYDVPEVIALPIMTGSPAYLQWIDTETKGL